jgi:predicted  nucleic acid-binding Zn-ribbon protein
MMVSVAVQHELGKGCKHTQAAPLPLLEELEEECRELVQRRLAIEEDIAQRALESSSVAGALSGTLESIKCEMRSLADRQRHASTILVDLTNEVSALLQEEAMLCEEIDELQIQDDIRKCRSETETGVACPERILELKRRSSMSLQMEQAESTSVCNELRRQAAEWIDFLRFRQERAKVLNENAAQLSFDKEELDEQVTQIRQQVQSINIDKAIPNLDTGATKISERGLQYAQYAWQVCFFLPFLFAMLASLWVQGQHC